MREDEQSPIQEAPDEAVRDLAVAVFAQAVSDARTGNIIMALDAVYWLTGPDAALWLDALNLSELDLVEAVTSGKLQEKRRGRLHNIGRRGTQ